MIPRWTRWLLPLALCHGLEGRAAEYGFRILDAQLVPIADQYALNADIDYRFSAPAIDALEHGVPLTVVIQFKIQRHRDYWLDETLLSESRRFFIHYHPLAKTYQIANESSGATRDFASLRASLDALGEIRGWRALPKAAFAPGREYWVGLAAKLDIEALPLPLRPLAYVSPGWYLGSPWFRWRVSG
ncbi:DUF4390 domain-containing protein [Methylomagnum ishizawai]|uniref:DUF4390 domain-containing protein n=1 Tax=Methylomagnum ishizawai TaxID=1760988 RepID=UPI001C31FFFD|nr:DUF4390 domain-containing protein [Methylomagnum ishizawai]BBL76521.1 hypothetical protein MishRS11D_36190 [Methylomagnum ishizawai]